MQEHTYQNAIIAPGVGYGSSDPDVKQGMTVLSGKAELVADRVHRAVERQMAQIHRLEGMPPQSLKLNPSEAVPMGRRPVLHTLDQAISALDRLDDLQNKAAELA